MLFCLFIQSTSGMVFVKKNVSSSKNSTSFHKRHLRRMGWGWCVFFQDSGLSFDFKSAKIKSAIQKRHTISMVIDHLLTILIGMILQTLASECSESSDRSKQAGGESSENLSRTAQSPPRWNLSSCCERCYPRPLFSQGFGLWSQPWSSVLARKNLSSKDPFKNPHAAIVPIKLVDITSHLSWNFHGKQFTPHTAAHLLHSKKKESGQIRISPT